MQKTLFDKIQHPFMIKKTPIEMSREGIYFNVYEKPTVNIILNSGKLKAFVQGQKKADHSHHFFLFVCLFLLVGG